MLMGVFSDYGFLKKYGYDYDSYFNYKFVSLGTEYSMHISSSTIFYFWPSRAKDEPHLWLHFKTDF